MAGFEAFRWQLPNEMLALLNQIALSVGNEPIPPGGTVTQTVDQISNIWVTESGNDSTGDGLTEATAFRTLERAGAVFSGILGPTTEFVVIHLRGTLAISSSFQFAYKTIRPSGTVIIVDGGTDVTELLVPTVSDINAAGQIGLTTGGYTHNQFRGCWLEVISGPMAGNRYSIRKNDTTTFYLLETGPSPLGDPGAGAEFRIIRPATTITAPALSDHTFGLCVMGNHSAYMQNLTFSGGAVMGYQSGESGVSGGVFSHIVHEGGASCVQPAQFSKQTSTIRFGATLWDTSTPTPTSSSSERIGVGQISHTQRGFTFDTVSGRVELDFSVLPEVDAIHGGPLHFRGSSTEFLYVVDQQTGGYASEAMGDHTAILGDSPGVPTRFGGYRNDGDPVTEVYPAIVAIHSHVGLNQSILDESTHGLELLAGSVAILREVSGSNNSISGAYVHAQSTILIYRKDGSGIPTLSGNGGAVELSEDGTTQVATWADASAIPVSTPECICQSIQDSIWRSSWQP